MMTVLYGDESRKWFPAAWKIRAEICENGEVLPIYRDILIPEGMPLRLFRYVIDQVFFWNPSLTHRFSLSEEQFFRMTEDRFLQYCLLCGIYFRFPTQHDEEDYWMAGEEDAEAWLRKHYRGSYTYHGDADHYVENQMAVRNFLMVFTGLQETPVIDLDKYRSGEVTLEKKKPVRAAQMSMKEVMENELFIRHPNQLLERMPVTDVLTMKVLHKEAHRDYSPWGGAEFYPDTLWKGYYERCFDRLERIHQRSLEAVMIHHELMDRKIVRIDEELSEEDQLLVERFAEAQTEARQSYQRLVRETMPEIDPFANEIFYFRDDIDEISVRLTIRDHLIQKNDGETENVRGEKVSPAMKELVHQTLMKRVPVCCYGEGEYSPEEFSMLRGENGTSLIKQLSHIEWDKIL